MRYFEKFERKQRRRELQYQLELQEKAIFDKKVKKEKQ